MRTVLTCMSPFMLVAILTRAIGQPDVMCHFENLLSLREHVQTAIPIVDLIRGYTTTNLPALHYRIGGGVYVFERGTGSIRPVVVKQMRDAILDLYRVAAAAGRRGGGTSFLPVQWEVLLAAIASSSSFPRVGQEDDDK